MQGVGGNWSCLASKMLLLNKTNKRIENIKLANLQSEVKVLLLFKLSIIVSIAEVSFNLLLIFESSEY